METYIEDSLAARCICPSASPAGAEFLCRSTKSCTCALNHYPLPLIALAFQLLQGATILSKLNLRNAYHVVQIQKGDE
jgi:hypothetical protein